MKILSVLLIMMIQILTQYGYAQYTESQVNPRGVMSNSSVTLINPPENGGAGIKLSDYSMSVSNGTTNLIFFQANNLTIDVSSDGLTSSNGNSASKLTGIYIEDVADKSEARIGESTFITVTSKNNYSANDPSKIETNGILVNSNDTEPRHITKITIQGSESIRNKIEVNTDGRGSTVRLIGGTKADISHTDLIYNQTNSEIDSGYVISLEGKATNGTTPSLTLGNTSLHSNRNGIIMTNPSTKNFMTLNIRGNTEIIAENNAIELYGPGRNMVSIGGKEILIKGDILINKDSSILLMVLQEGSFFQGKISTHEGLENLQNNKSSVLVTLEKARWDMTDSSFVNQLKLTNSKINFLKNDDFSVLYLIVPTSGGANLVLSADGNSTINMGVNFNGSNGQILNDKIVLRSSSDRSAKTEGLVKLGLINQGSANTTGHEVVTLVETQYGSTGNISVDNDATYIIDNETNKVEFGAYEYELRRNERPTGVDIELSSNGISTTPDLPSNPPQTSTTADAATSFININYLLNIIENQTLLQRLGDLRNGSQLEGNGGFWGKAWGGKLSSFSGTLSGFDMKYYGLQTGYDKIFKLKEGDLIFGAMIGYTHSSPDYRKGSGTGKSYSLGIYGTYFTNNGTYIDSLLRYSRIRNKFAVLDTAGQTVSGESKTHAISFSLEMGRRFWLQQQNQGLYIEPQGQVTLSYQNGDTIHSSNGLRVKMDSYNSSQVRLSGIIGYQWNGSSNPSNIYFKTGFVREMSGSTKYKFNDTAPHDYSFRGNWLEMGIGANIKINQRHNISAELDYYKGHKFDNLRAQLHYRYDF